MKRINQALAGVGPSLSRCGRHKKRGVWAEGEKLPPFLPLSTFSTRAAQASTLYHCVLTRAECATNLCTAFDYWYIVFIFILKLPEAATTKWKSHCSN